MINSFLLGFYTDSLLFSPFLLFFFFFEAEFYCVAQAGLEVEVLLL